MSDVAAIHPTTLSSQKRLKEGFEWVSHDIWVAAVTSKQDGGQSESFENGEILV